MFDIMVEAISYTGVKFVAVERIMEYHNIPSEVYTAHSLPSYEWMDRYPFTIQ